MLWESTRKPPTSFQPAEFDNLRDGRLGIEIYSARERIVIALSIRRFGEENITTNIPITENEAGVIVFNILFQSKP
ncbi:ThaI family type II restriction endonuclease [Rickettsiales bacterium]|nr:ThaI family type II restriction endonuclease [Rickettsiales bacterium]